MYTVNMAIFNIQRATTLQVGKQELRFMCSSCHLMFHENMSSSFKVMEQTHTHTHIHTHTHTHTHIIENYIPHCMHTSYAGV